MITKEQLSAFKKDLKTANERLYIDKKLLTTFFGNCAISPTKLEDNFYGNPNKNCFSYKYVNDAYVWYQIFNRLKISNKNTKIISEICPGNSLTIDMALSFLRYSNELIKVDYTTYKLKPKFRAGYSVEQKHIDVLEETEKMPKSDLFILNHGSDDLMLGIYSKQKGITQFHKTPSPKVCNRYLHEAMKIQEYVKKLERFIAKLAKRVTNKGYIIIKEYPCSPATYYLFVDYVNLCFVITKVLVNKLLNVALKW